MKTLKGILEELKGINDSLKRLAPRSLPATNFNEAAFRWQSKGERSDLVAISRTRPTRLQDLCGIDLQKQILVRNTLQFLHGLPSNNALLWGSRGTGKSTLIRALLDTYQDFGLRMIEVDRIQLAELPDIAQKVIGRPERFILFCDDLGFENSDASFKALKAALEGSLAEPPDNLLIYATSNRRHLMPEFMKDNLASRLIEGELHHGETVEETISLSERFGVWLSFHPFTQEQYLQIVEHWLIVLGGEESLSEVREEALAHALVRGSRSGRVAYQFAKDRVGRSRLEALPNIPMI